MKLVKIFLFLFLFILLFLFLFFGMVGGAHASVSLSNYNAGKEIKVNYEYGTTLPELVSIVNNSSIMSMDGDICYINGYLRMYSNSYLYINNTTVSEIRFNNTKLSTIVPNQAPGLYEGLYYIENVSMKSWNYDQNRPAYRTEPQMTITTTGGYIKNVYLEGIYSVGINSPSSNINNITMIEGSKGIIAKRIFDTNFSEICTRNFNGSAIEVYDSNNTNIYNCDILNAGDYLRAGSGRHGILFSNVSNSTIHDCEVNGTGWSSIDLTSSYTNDEPSRHLTLYNLTVRNTGHNGLDIHACQYATVTNMSIYDPFLGTADTNSIVCTFGNQSNYYFTHDIYFKNISTYNTTPGTGAFFTNSGNISIENYTSTNENSAVSYLHCKNMTLKNIVMNNSKYGITYTYSTKTPRYVIDPIFLDSDVYSALLWGVNTAGYTSNSKSINIRYLPAKARFFNLNADGTVLYYGDFVVKNETGIQLNGSILLSDENYAYAGTDASGTNKSSFSFNGRTVLPSVDRSNSIAIPQFYVNSTSTKEYSTTADISTVAGNVSLNNITPYDVWYRRNISESNYTITATINNSESLHFTGYAPSPEYNTFQNNSLVKMQVWANEPLTNVVWKVDGVEKQNSTSTIYESTVGTAPITVDLTGSTATETISKSWVIDPTQTIEPDPEGSAPVANFSVDSTTGFKNTTFTFTDSSSNTPTHWYWDFDNDGVTDSTSQNPTKQFKVAGNYTVKLTVSNGNGMNTETKTAYIQVSGTSGTKKRWYSPFVDWISLFRTYFLGAWLA